MLDTATRKRTELVERPTQRWDARPRTVAVIPAYNEERFIGSVVLNVQPYVDDVIVVDDGSTDGTARVAEAAGATVVSHEANSGKGRALNTGLRVARDIGAGAVVLIDGDGQHRADEIPGVVGPILRGEADVVAGSRYLKAHDEVPRGRVLGHWAFNWLTGAASGARLSDSQNGFRALSASALQALHFSSEGFSVESEMQFLIRDHDLRVVEAPVTTHYHDAPKRSVVVHGLIVLNGVLRLTGQYRPLLFFGASGMGLLLIGLGWGAWVVDIYRRNAQLAVGYALLSVLLSIMGVQTLFTGLMLHSVRALLLDGLKKITGRDLEIG